MLIDQAEDAAGHDVARADVGLAEVESDGDRLQHLRAALPCEVRVTAETHPLFGQLLWASGFKRLNAVLHLVVRLPDGSPGTIRADATDVVGETSRSAAASVLTAEGVRALRELVAALAPATRRRPRVVAGPGTEPVGAKNA